MYSTCASFEINKTKSSSLPGKESKSKPSIITLTYHKKL